MCQPKESILFRFTILIVNLLSIRITAGKDNVLFHYVQIESGEGILLAPPCLQSANLIAYSFQKASILIHNILQNTIRYNGTLLIHAYMRLTIAFSNAFYRFRHLLSQETTTPNMHRSLVAIKEHGILISCENNSGQQMHFWVIGFVSNKYIQTLPRFDHSIKCAFFSIQTTVYEPIERALCLPSC